MPRTTEAVGFREALIAANIRGFAHIIVEGDSSQIVQALSQEGKNFSDCSSIVTDCLKLAIMFSSCFFVHVKRSNNKVAHSLAK